MSKTYPEATVMLQEERDNLAAFIQGLSFNKFHGGKTLVMISGDIHLMGYSHGGHALNPKGHFPIFQCAPMD
jgi:hypothetical protein